MNLYHETIDGNLRFVEQGDESDLINRFTDQTFILMLILSLMVTV